MLPKILDHRHPLTEAAIELFLENGYTFYGRQIMLLNIVPLRSFWAQNAQAAYQRDLGKVRQIREIKFTRIYDKW